MEDVLLSYGGVLLVVSHDRRCMQTLTDRLFVLEGDGVVRLFDGPYYDVRIHCCTTRTHLTPAFDLCCIVEACFGSATIAHLQSFTQVFSYI